MIYVVLPVHNRYKSTEVCIKSIYSNCTQSLEVIVVDDGSTDNTSELLTVNFPDVKVLAGNGNLFWTGAVALAIDYVIKVSRNNDWIILMNNDVLISSPDVFENLISFSESHNRKALVSPLTVDKSNPDRTITTGTQVDSWFFNTTKHIYSNKITSEIGSMPIPVDFMTARCLLHPVEIFTELGNYNCKLFPHYGGDDEFSYRAKRNGYGLYICPLVKVQLDNNKSFRFHNMNIISILLFLLFNKRSSVSVVDKIKFGFTVPPTYSRITYTLVGVVKSLITAIRSCVIHFKSES